MGGMAGKTIFRCQDMLIFLVGNGIRKIFMTAEAKLIPGSLQIEFIFRRMGIMTLDAVPGNHHLVITPGLLGSNPLVAAETNFIRIFGNQSAVTGSMRVMAIRAIPRFHRRVDKWKLQSFLEFLVAGETDFSFRSRFQPEFILAGSGRTEPSTRSQCIGKSSHHPYFLSTIWHSSQDLAANGGCIFSL
jgi:hypothetical protein